MKQSLFIASVLLTAPILAQELCPTSNETVIVYGNGIRTTKTQARYELEYLLEKLQPYLEQRSIDPAIFSPGCLAYDSTYIESQAGQLFSINTLLQLWQGYSQTQIEPVQEFWYWLSNAPLAPSWFNQIEQNLGMAIGDGVSVVLQPDIFSQLQMYQAALLQPPTGSLGDAAKYQTLVVVAHSQGNLYANQVYDLLFPSISSFGASRFKLISIATPADHVAGGGPYTTLTNDPIWLVSGALPSNTDNGPCIDETCPTILPNIAFHDFTSSYLDGQVSGPQILNEVVAAIPKPQRITVTFTGTVSTIYDPNNRLPSGRVAVGNQVVATLTYDPNAPNSNNNPQTFQTQGQYNENLADTGLTFTIFGPEGAQAFTNLPGDQSIEVALFPAMQPGAQAESVVSVNTHVITPLGFPAGGYPGFPRMALTFINELGFPPFLTSSALITNWQVINLAQDQNNVQNAIFDEVATTNGTTITFTSDWSIMIQWNGISQK